MLVCGIAHEPSWLTKPHCRYSPPTGDHVAFSWAEDVVSTWCLCYHFNTQIMLVSHPRMYLRLAIINHVNGTVRRLASNRIKFPVWALLE